MSVLLHARTFIHLHGCACAKELPDAESLAFAGSPFSSDSAGIKQKITCVVKGGTCQKCKLVPMKQHLARFVNPAEFKCHADLGML